MMNYLRQENMIDKNMNRFVLAIILTNVIAMLNTSTVTISLPTYVKIFQVDINSVQWVATSYMLPLGMMMPLSGYLCERYSYRNVFLFGIVMMGVCSLGCACSVSFIMLVFFRALKGVAGGIIIPSTMAMLYRYLPESKQAVCLGQVVLFQSVGLMIGPTLAGILLQLSNWRWMFLMNLPLLLMVLWLSYSSLPSEKGTKDGHIDLSGILQVSLGTGLVMFSFTKGADWGWNSIRFLEVVIIGLLLIVVFVYRQLHIAYPMLNFSILKYKPFTLTVIVQCTLSMTMGINAILAQFYFQTGLNWTPAETGIFLLIPSVVMVIGNNVANRLHKKGFMKSLIVGGLGIALAGNLGLCTLSLESNLIFVLLCYCIRFWGLSLINMPLTNYGLSAVPSELAGHASSMFSWTKQVAQVMSINILTVALNVNLNRYYWEAGNIGMPVEGMAYRLAAVQAVNTDYCYLTCFIVLSLCCSFFIKAKKSE